MTHITDGTGKGFSTKVNSVNKLVITATSHTDEHEAAEVDGQAYFANTTDTADTLTLATGNTYHLLFLRNLSSTKILVVQKVSVSASVAGLTLCLQKNMTLGAVSDNNVHVPVNVNFSSGNSADVLSHNWDETGTVGITGLSAGTRIKTFIMSTGPFIIPVDGFMVLGQNDSLTLMFVNGTGGNVEAEAGIRFYFDDLGK